MGDDVSDQHASMLAFSIAVAWVCLAETSPWTRLPSALSFALVTLFICFVVLIDFLFAGRRVTFGIPRFLEALNLRQKMRQVFGRYVSAELRNRFHQLGRAKRQRTLDTCLESNGHEVSDLNRAVPEETQSCT